MCVCVYRLSSDIFMRYTTKYSTDTLLTKCVSQSFYTL